MYLTYKELIEVLQNIPEERLEDTVTVKVDGEYYPVGDYSIMHEDDDDGDILDHGHFYLIIE